MTATATDPDAPDAGSPVSTTTGDDGSYVLDGLVAGEEYSIAVDGADPVTTTAPATGLTIALAPTDDAGSTPPPTGGPTPPPSGGGSTGTVSDPGSGVSSGQLAYSGSNAAPAVIGGGILVLLGAAFLVARGVRTRRRRDHLVD